MHKLFPLLSTFPSFLYLTHHLIPPPCPPSPPPLPPSMHPKMLPLWPFLTYASPFVFFFMPTHVVLKHCFENIVPKQCLKRPFGVFCTEKKTNYVFFYSKGLFTRYEGLSLNKVCFSNCCHGWVCLTGHRLVIFQWKRPSRKNCATTLRCLSTKKSFWFLGKKCSIVFFCFGKSMFWDPPPSTYGMPPNKTPIVDNPCLNSLSFLWIPHMWWSPPPPRAPTEKTFQKMCFLFVTTEKKTRCP